MNTKKAAWIISLVFVVGMPVSALAQPGGTTNASQATTSALSSKSADRALRKRVRTVLAKDKKINAANITVRAREGAVTLEGSVTSQDELLRAEEIAKSVSGVNSVRNALVIRQPGK